MQAHIDKITFYCINVEKYKYLIQTLDLKRCNKEIEKIIYFNVNPKKNLHDKK